MMESADLELVPGAYASFWGLYFAICHGGESFHQLWYVRYHTMISTATDTRARWPLRASALRFNLGDALPKFRAQKSEFKRLRATGEHLTIS